MFAWRYPSTAVLAHDHVKLLRQHLKATTKDQEFMFILYVQEHAGVHSKRFLTELMRCP